jgi:molecular chaperone DnaK
VKTFFGKEPHQGVNPDEVVAVGAAVQAGVLSGDVKDMVLLDVTPLSLGIETLGGIMTVMIPRNTTLPTQKKETFSTASDNQPSVEVHVLQGERSEAKYNRTLGNFQLQGIMPAPRGVPKVEVSFDVDANGILSVTAKDTATGKDQKITITASSGLSEAEIQKMVKEAAEHEADDKVQREQVERRNKLDNICYSAEKALRENKDKIPAADAASLDALIHEGRQAVEKQDDGLITGVTERLEKEAARVASTMQQGAGADAAPQQAAPDAKRDRKDIADAEFEETPHQHP